MKTKEKTVLQPPVMYRLFVTRFHSPHKCPAKTTEGRRHFYTKNEIHYKRDRIVMDREFPNSESARKWVSEQKSGKFPDDSNYQWCELWGEPVPVSDSVACEKAKLEFETYEEQFLPGL